LRQLEVELAGSTGALGVFASRLSRCLRESPGLQMDCACPEPVLLGSLAGQERRYVAARAAGHCIRRCRLVECSPEASDRFDLVPSVSGIIAIAGEGLGGAQSSLDELVVRSFAPG
jgi:hypothetical protein